MSANAKVDIAPRVDRRRCSCEDIKVRELIRLDVPITNEAPLCPEQEKNK